MRSPFFSLCRLALPAVACALISSGAALAAGDSVQAALKSQHESGVSATATLLGQGDSTVVTLKIIGGKGKQFLPDLRSGSCANAAETPEIPLAMASSNSPSETTIDIPLADLSAGSYVIMLHRADGDLTSLGPKTALACGAIGARAEIANTAPVTGIGPIGSDASVRWLAVALGGAAAIAAGARRVQRMGATT